MLRIVTLAALVSGFCPPPIADDDRYFPRGVFDADDREHDDRVASRYTKYLRAAGEPPLFNRPGKGARSNTYRLLWLPTFHSPICIRIVKSDKITAYITRLGGRGGYEPGKVSARLAKPVTEGQWDSLQRLLERSRFWTMPTTADANLAGGLALDGDQLVCEGVDGQRYHVVDRDDADPHYQNLCKYMLELSGLDIKKTWAHYHGEEEKRGISR
jgi:hypothetical protein